MWYASDTLIACFSVLLATLCVSLLLRRLLSRSAGDKGGGPAPGDFRGQQQKVASNYLGRKGVYRILGYVFLLGVICIAGAELLGTHTTTGGQKSLIVSTRPGLGAATALLMPVAFGSFVVTLVVVLISLQYGIALVDTGLLAVIWTFVLSAVVGLIAGAACVSASPLGPPLLAGSVFGLLLGFYLRSFRPIGGETTSRLAREKREGAEWEHAQYEKHRAPERGEYIGRAPRVRKLRNTSADGVGITYEVQLIPLASRVCWDSDGIEVEWPGDRKAKRFSWGELTSLKTTDLGRRLMGSIVTTASGDEIRVTALGDRYAQLLQALEAHIWDRKGSDD